MDRRKFIEQSGAAIMSAYFLSGCRSARPVNSYPSSGKAFIFLESRKGISTARIVDLTTMNYKDIEVPLVNAHSAQRILTGEDEFIAFDFMGRAVKANLRTGEILKAPQNNSVFMGHGTQTNDGELIWCTEVKNKSEILVQARRTADLSLAPGTSHVFLGGHHITKLPDSDFLATGWYDIEKKYPTVRFYNRKTGETKIAKLPDHVTVSHLLALSSTEVVAITHVLSEKKEKDDSWNNKPIIQTAYDSMLKTNTKTERPSGKLDFDPASPAPLIYANTSGEARTFWVEDHAQLFRYGFSIDALPGQTKKFISTHTLGNSVIIWNANQTVDHYVTVPSPMGAIATPDGERVLILSLGKIKIWSVIEKKFVDEITYERPVFSLSRYS